MVIMIPCIQLDNSLAQLRIVLVAVVKVIVFPVGIIALQLNQVIGN